jgi:hypothetical protein
MQHNSWRPLFRAVLAAAVGLAAAASVCGSAARTLAAEQRPEIEALDKLATEAARLYVQKKYREAGDTVRQVQEKMSEMAAGGDAEVIAALDAVYQRLAKAHALLELEGISLPPLKKPSAAGPAKPSAAEEAENARRAEQAVKNWRLVVPATPPNRVETAHFLVLGDASDAALKQVGDAAESLLPKVAELLDAPADKPLFQGRVTMFLCEQRRAYARFGKLVEKRDLPAQWPGHWRREGEDAYAVSVAASGGQPALEVLLGQQLAGLYVAGLGRVPQWFAEGSARIVAARLNPQDERVTAWDQGLPDVIIESLGQPGDLVADRLTGEAGGIAGYGFAKFLAADAKRYRALLAALRAGKSFDAAFTAAYRGSPERLVQTWLKPSATAEPKS